MTGLLQAEHDAQERAALELLGELIRQAAELARGGSYGYALETLGVAQQAAELYRTLVEIELDARARHLIR
jgi:hypothetical protein